jgi:hypothetical protein
MGTLRSVISLGSRRRSIVPDGTRRYFWEASPTLKCGATILTSLTGQAGANTARFRDFSLCRLASFLTLAS